MPFGPSVPGPPPSPSPARHQYGRLTPGHGTGQKLLLARPAIRDEGPRPLDRCPRVERRLVELLSASTYTWSARFIMSSLKTGLDRLGLADAEPCIERVRPQERPVRGQPGQAELGQRADEALAHLPQVAAQVDDLHAFGVGERAARGHSVGDDGEALPARRRQPPGEPAGRGSGVEDQGLAVGDEGRGEASDLFFLRRRRIVDRRPSVASRPWPVAIAPPYVRASSPRSVSSDRSLRMVEGVTSNDSASSSTLTRPWAALAA